MIIAPIGDEGNNDDEKKMRIDEDSVQIAKKAKQAKPLPNPSPMQLTPQIQPPTTMKKKTNWAATSTILIAKILATIIRSLAKYTSRRGEVNCARYMPQNHLAFAICSPSSEVYIWGLSKNSSFPSDGENKVIAPSPQANCRGHTIPGKGMV